MRKIDKDKCPKCKENYVDILGGSYKRICKCSNPKMYEGLKEAFEKAFSGDYPEEHEGI